MFPLIGPDDGPAVCRSAFSAGIALGVYLGGGCSSPCDHKVLPSWDTQQYLPPKDKGMWPGDDWGDDLLEGGSPTRARRDISLSGAYFLVGQAT